MEQLKDPRTRTVHLVATLVFANTNFVLLRVLGSGVFFFVLVLQKEHLQVWSAEIGLITVILGSSQRDNNRNYRNLKFFFP